MKTLKKPNDNSQNRDASLTHELYKSMHRQSLENTELFWAAQAELQLDWYKHWDSVVEEDFATGDVSWFKGGKLNASVNCIDRHLDARADQTAIIWERDDPTQSQRISYQELHDHVCRLANGLKELGVVKGDRVCLYMPMIPQTIYAMLACCRIGAIHSVVFGGFSPNALKGRINDSGCRLVITADQGLRGQKRIPLKDNVDLACSQAPRVQDIIVCKVTDAQIEMQDGRDHWYEDLVSSQSPYCEPDYMDAEDPLFILYTSGSTGTPKGVVHTTGGYLLYAAMTFKYVFDYRDRDVFWCTVDIGWITGHSYLVYGPLANGATTLVYEGVPSYPDYSRFWRVIQKHKVTTFYTAPTAIRAIMGAGDACLKNVDLSTLRVLGTVGELINQQAWQWYYHKIGGGRCPIVDTWWQTETGGVMIAPLPGAIEAKPGCVALPFFGIEPVIVDDDGNVIEGQGSGNLVLPRSWPGQMRGVFNDPEGFRQTYFSLYPGYYFTGDGCRRDKDGCYWITGRVDDVVNVSGHRMGMAEVESALVQHPAVAESAAVGYPHALKGQGICAYVTLIAEVAYTDELKSELIHHVRSQIGPIATPDIIHWAPELPKTRSGKVTRRILRKIAENDLSNLGNCSSPSDP